MKKPILTSALALAMAAGVAAPAQAGDTHEESIEISSIDWSFATSNPFSYLIYLLVPAVQAAR